MLAQQQKIIAINRFYSACPQNRLQLEQVIKQNSRIVKISFIHFVLCHKIPDSSVGALVFPLQHNIFVLCHKMLVFPFLTLEQHTTFKESMINLLSQVLCSTVYA